MSEQDRPPNIDHRAHFTRLGLELAQLAAPRPTSSRSIKDPKLRERSKPAEGGGGLRPPVTSSPPKAAGGAVRRRRSCERSEPAGAAEQFAEGEAASGASTPKAAGGAVRRRRSCGGPRPPVTSSPPKAAGGAVRRRRSCGGLRPPVTSSTPKAAGGAVRRRRSCGGPRPPLFAPRHLSCAFSSLERHVGGARSSAPRHGKFAGWTTSCLVGPLLSALRRTSTYLCEGPRFRKEAF